MQVSLPPDLEQFVGQQMASGRYHTTGEVLTTALRLLEDRERLRQAKHAALKAAIDEGFASAERDGWLDGKAVMDELRARAARGAGGA